MSQKTTPHTKEVLNEDTVSWLLMLLRLLVRLAVLMMLLTTADPAVVGQ
jgi:hypothetical protein